MTISILSQPCCCILATVIVRKQCQKLCKYFSTFFFQHNTCVTTLNIDQAIHPLSLSLSNISSININKEDYSIIDPQNIDKSRTLSQIEK